MAAMTAIAVGSLIYGAYTQARGQLKAGKAAKDAGESQAQQLEFNAGVADLQAADALQRGREEEQQFRTQVRGMVATQRTGFAGQNVDISSGSAADVQGDTAYLGELDARRIRANAQREAWGYGVQGEDLRQAAGVARKGGQAAASAARTAAVGTVIGAGSTYLMSRYGWDRNVQTSRAV